MLISVIIPVYNGENYLTEAINSIRVQNYSPVEIIVVDDGSTDGTSTLARSLGPDIRYIYQPNAGPAAARNRGLAVTHGDFIAFLDADDLWPQKSLHLRLTTLERAPNTMGVIGYTRGLMMSPAVTGMKPSHILSDPWYLPMLVGCGLFRRTLIEKVGSFNSSLICSEDLDWYLRLREANVHLTKIDAVTLHYRLHGHSLTNGRNSIQRGVLHAIKLSLDRRRLQVGNAMIQTLAQGTIKEVE
jgi:glycosyltransferase involved in cell wall biosynthesis